MFDTLFEEIKRDPQALGNVVGAIIGVVGLFVGTFISIITSFIVRNMDIKREERRERALLEKAKKEKAFGLKQEVYSEFISELASMENFISKKTSNKSLTNLENFDHEWTRIEIKVDLVASPKVIEFKEKLQEVLMTLAKQKFTQKDQSKEIGLSPEYMSDRQALLEAIRNDMEIKQ